MRASSVFALTNRKGDCLALSVILLATLVYFKGAIVDGLVYFEPDTTSFYYPVMSLVNGALKQFSIPLWTPYIFGGYPLFADGEAGMLYPLNLLLWWLLPMQQMFLWGWVVRFFLAGTFTYAYCRSLRLNRLGSLIAGLVFTFGSFNVTQLHHTNIGNSAVWLPLILCFVELGLRAVGSRRRLFLLLAGAALGVQSLGVHVQPVLLALLLFCFYVPFRVWVGNSFEGRRSDGLAALSLREKLIQTLEILVIVPLVGLSIAAVQLLPLYELGTFSFRGTGVSYSFATSYSLPLQNLITLVWPYFFLRSDGSSWSLWIEWESTVYVGILPLLLAIAGATRRRGPISIFYAFIAVFSLLMAFGDYSPIKAYWLIWQLPGFSSLRAPARFSYLFVFATAVLAGYGWEWLEQAMASARRTKHHWASLRNYRIVGTIGRLSTASFCLSMTLLASIFWMYDFALPDKNSVTRFVQANYLALRHQNPNITVDNVYDALRMTFNPTNMTTLQPILVLAAIGAVLILWHRWYHRTRLWQTLLIGLALGDLLLFAGRFHPTQNWDTIAAPSGPVRFLAAQEGLHRVYNRYNGLRSEPNRMLPFKVSAVDGYSSLEEERNSAFIKSIEHGNTRLLNLANVQYIVGKNGQPPIGPLSAIAYQEGDVVIYRNDSFFPRAFIADSFVVANSDSKVLENLENKDLDLSRTVVLEENPKESFTGRENLSYTIASARPVELNAQASGTAEVKDYKREDVTIDVNLPQDGFLVLTDSFYPGWTAYLDGQETKIYRADYLFRAISVPAGQHEVEFVFHSAAFEIGKVISIVTVLIVLITGIALLFVPQIRHRRDPGSASLADRFGDL